MSILLDSLTLMAFPVNLLTLAWIQTLPVDPPRGIGRKPPAPGRYRELPGLAATPRSGELPGAAEELRGAAGSRREPGAGAVVGDRGQLPEPDLTTLRSWKC